MAEETHASLCPSTSVPEAGWTILPTGATGLLQILSANQTGSALKEKSTVERGQHPILLVWVGGPAEAEGARECSPARGTGPQGWPLNPTPRRPRCSFSDFIFANVVAATATPLPAVGTSWPFVMETGALQTWFLV